MAGHSAQAMKGEALQRPQRRRGFTWENCCSRTESTMTDRKEEAIV